MKPKAKRSAIDYAICALAALFIFVYASVAATPVTSESISDSETVREQPTDNAPSEKSVPKARLGEMVVTFIDVSQGDSTFIELPDGKTMLVDAGEASSSESVLNVLDDADVSSIDYLVASHPHSDHIGGMEAVLNAFEVGEVWMPDISDATETYERFLDAVETEGCEVERAVAGKDIVGKGKGYTVELLAPEEGVDSDDLNRHSAIIRISYEDTSLLIAGDADADQIVEANPGHVDVLRASHHGSETGTTPEVITETKPNYVILSYAEGNPYGHPDQNALDAISSGGSTCLSTASNGNIVCVFDGNDVKVNPDHQGNVVAGMTAEERAAEEARAQAEAQEQSEGPAQQQATPQPQMVVITPSGEKYHRSGCRTLSRSKTLTELTKDEAISMGYAPCNVCNP